MFLILIIAVSLVGLQGSQHCKGLSPDSYPFCNTKLHRRSRWFYPVTASEDQDPTLFCCGLIRARKEGNQIIKPNSLEQQQCTALSSWLKYIHTDHSIRKFEYHVSIQVSSHLAYVVIKSLKVSTNQVEELLACYGLASEAQHHSNHILMVKSTPGAFLDELLCLVLEVHVSDIYY